MDEYEKAKDFYERLRKKSAKYFMKKYNRMLPLDEMLADRWKKAEALNFGGKSSVYENVYIYGKPKIGKKVWIGPFNILDATGGLEIGDGCDIGVNVMIFSHSSHMRAISEGKIDIIKKPVKIGSFTFIGTGAIILPGVEIGDHCVIGAGAVVTSNIPSYSVAFGVPAKVVGKVILQKESVKIEYF